MPQQLNYKHLHYFWVIAREGSIVAASKVLHLSPQTLSGQLANLKNQWVVFFLQEERDSCI